MSDDYCDTHDVDIESLPNRDQCPYCRMEEDRQAQLVERATRHHPKVVDDPASIDAYRR